MARPLFCIWPFELVGPNLRQRPYPASDQIASPDLSGPVGTCAVSAAISSTKRHVAEHCAMPRVVDADCAAGGGQCVWPCLFAAPLGVAAGNIDVCDFAGSGNPGC